METVFSSKSAEWETDLTFFNKLNKIFHFTLDPCATPENALCKKFYTIVEDGLIQNWEGEHVFMNPPYNKIKDWMLKAYEEGQDPDTPDTLIVCLVPSRTDTKWMHKYGFKADWIVDIEGRLKFGNRLLPSWREDGSHKISSAPFPSRLIIYAKCITEQQIKELMKIGQVLKPITLNILESFYK